jgi:hypothetical protein
VPVGLTEDVRAAAAACSPSIGLRGLCGESSLDEVELREISAFASFTSSHRRRAHSFRAMSISDLRALPSKPEAEAHAPRLGQTAPQFGISLALNAGDGNYGERPCTLFIG